jgi:deazaflavin-dependent oxidoreductase (nitroreductase family)
MGHAPRASHPPLGRPIARQRCYAARMAKPPPSWMVRLNVAMLRRGMRIGTQYLLSVRGRRTGQSRSTPISIATVDGVRYIVAAFGATAWVRNVRAAGAGTLSRGANSETVRLQEIPITERGPVLRAFLAQVRGGRRFFGDRTPDQVVAAADQFPVFRVSSQ